MEVKTSVKTSDKIDATVGVPMVPSVINLTKSDGLDWYKVTYVIEDNSDFSFKIERSVILHSKKVRAKDFADAVKQVEEYINRSYIFGDGTKITFIKAELEGA